MKPNSGPLVNAKIKSTQPLVLVELGDFFFSTSAITTASFIFPANAVVPDLPYAEGTV